MEFEERARDCSPGHAGKEGLHLAMTEASRGFSGAGEPVWDFSRGMTGSSGSLSCGAREVKSPCEFRGGTRHCSRVMVGESGFKTREGGFSRSFSGCVRKPCVPSTCERERRNRRKNLFGKFSFRSLDIRGFIGVFRVRTRYLCAFCARFLFCARKCAFE